MERWMICVALPCRYKTRDSAEQSTALRHLTPFDWNIALEALTEMLVKTSVASEQKTCCDVRNIHSTRGNSWNTIIILSSCILRNKQSITLLRTFLFTKCLIACCQISQECEYVSMLVYRQSDSMLRGEESSYCSLIDGTELSKRVTHCSSSSSDTKQRRA